MSVQQGRCIISHSRQLGIDILNKRVLLIIVFNGDAMDARGLFQGIDEHFLKLKSHMSQIFC